MQRSDWVLEGSLWLPRGAMKRVSEGSWKNGVFMERGARVALCDLSFLRPETLSCWEGWREGPGWAGSSQRPGDKKRGLPVFEQSGKHEGDELRALAPEKVLEI